MHSNNILFQDLFEFDATVTQTEDGMPSFTASESFAVWSPPYAQVASNDRYLVIVGADSSPSMHNIAWYAQS